MKPSPHVHRFMAAAMLAACGLPHAGVANVALAQADYPTRPIRIVVAYPPGGSNDFLARLFGPKLTDIFGKQVVVDNRGGGNTIIGTDLVAKAPPDGYTLLLAGSSSIAISQIYRNVPFDVIKDFTPIALVVTSWTVFAVNPKVPANTLPELVAYSKTHPVRYGSGGIGGVLHIAGEMLKSLAGVNVTHVPYRSTALAMPDMIAGRIDYICEPIQTGLPFIQQNSIKTMATLTRERW